MKGKKIMTNEMTLVGKRIKNIREMKKISQEEVAKRVGITRQAVSHYEKGQRGASVEIIEKIATAMNVDISCLIYSSRENTDDECIFVPDESVRTIIFKLLCLPKKLRDRYFEHILFDSELERKVG